MTPDEALGNALRGLQHEAAQAAFPIEGDAAETRWMMERLNRLGFTVAARDSAGLDVERLARAMDVVSKQGGNQVSWGRGEDSIAAAIAREYARLSEPKP